MMNGRQNMPGAAITTLEVTTCTSFNKSDNKGYNKSHNKGYKSNNKEYNKVTTKVTTTCISKKS